MISIVRVRPFIENSLKQLKM